MTVSAYVLIQTEMDKAASVAAAIADIEGVVAVDVVTGPYDVIAKTSADTMDELGAICVGDAFDVASTVAGLNPAEPTSYVAEFVDLRDSVQEMADIIDPSLYRQRR